MNLLNLQTRVAEETGLDRGNTDDLASITAWINQAYQYVAGMYSWDWLFTQATIQTVADITTGTATVSANSSSVTLSVAPSVSGSSLSVAKQWMINFPTVSEDWYFIDTHTAATTALTMSVPFVSSSNLSAGAYKLRKVLYSLPSSVDRIIDVRRQVDSARLTYIDPRTFDTLMPNPTATGSPIYYSFVGRDTATSPNWQISLYPNPTETLNLQLKFYKHVTELVSATDEPELPKNWHDVLVFGALYLYGHAFIDDDRAALAKARFEQKILQMKAASSHVPDSFTIIQPWDTRTASFSRRPRLPENYQSSYGL